MSRRRIRHDELRTISNEEFKRIRKGLGLSQQQLASVLGYGHFMRVSELERETNPVEVPWLTAQLMLAMQGGFRPDTFVENDPFG